MTLSTGEVLTENGWVVKRFQESNVNLSNRCHQNTSALISNFRRESTTGAFDYRRRYFFEIGTPQKKVHAALSESYSGTNVSILRRTQSTVRFKTRGNRSFTTQLKSLKWNDFSRPRFKRLQYLFFLNLLYSFYHYRVCAAWCIPRFFHACKWGLHLSTRFQSTICWHNLQNSTEDLMHRGPLEAARALYFTVSHQFSSSFANFASFLDDRKCLWSDVRVVPCINDPPEILATQKRSPLSPKTEFQSINIGQFHNSVWDSAIHRNHEALRRYTSFFPKSRNVFLEYISSALLNKSISALFRLLQRWQYQRANKCLNTF